MFAYAILVLSIDVLAYWKIQKEMKGELNIHLTVFELITKGDSNYRFDFNAYGQSLNRLGKFGWAETRSSCRNANGKSPSQLPFR